MHQRGSLESLGFYNLELLSCRVKIESLYILFRLLYGLQETKLQLYTSLTFTMGPNYHRLVCGTSSLVCARCYGNVVQPEYFQSPDAGSSACIFVIRHDYCVVREEITCVSL